MISVGVARIDQARQNHKYVCKLERSPDQRTRAITLGRESRLPVHRRIGQRECLPCIVVAA
ncbi:hypothetical protein D3C71_1028300 [compost metagenome]